MDLEGMLWDDMDLEYAVDEDLVTWTYAGIGNRFPRGALSASHMSFLSSAAQPSGYQYSKREGFASGVLGTHQSLQFYPNQR